MISTGLINILTTYSLDLILLFFFLAYIVVCLKLSLLTLILYHSQFFSPKRTLLLKELFFRFDESKCYLEKARFLYFYSFKLSTHFLLIKPEIWLVDIIQKFFLFFGLGLSLVAPWVLIFYVVYIAVILDNLLVALSMYSISYRKFIGKYFLLGISLTDEIVNTIYG
jgi:hypothetical protein